MTHIPIALLTQRREQGLAPQGGLCSPEVLNDLKTPATTLSEKLNKLDSALLQFWEHPLDRQLLQVVVYLVGGLEGRSLAQIHEAASHIHRVKSEVQDIPESARCRAQQAEYQKLTDAIIAANS